LWSSIRDKINAALDNEAITRPPRYGEYWWPANETNAPTGVAIVCGGKKRAERDNSLSRTKHRSFVGASSACKRRRIVLMSSFGAIFIAGLHGAFAFLGYEE